MLERNSPFGEAPLSLKFSSKHGTGDLFAQTLKKINQHGNLSKLGEVTSEVEKNVIFAKRARALGEARQKQDVQYDYIEEKMVPISVSKGREVGDKTEFERLRFSQNNYPVKPL